MVIRFTEGKIESIEEAESQDFRELKAIMLDRVDQGDLIVDRVSFSDAVVGNLIYPEMVLKAAERSYIVVADVIEGYIKELEVGMECEVVEERVERVDFMEEGILEKIRKQVELKRV